MRKSFAFGVVPLLLLLASSCQAFYDLSASQCSTDADCDTRFGRGLICDLGVCRDTTSSSGSSGKGGTNNSGSSTGATAGTSVDEGGNSGKGGTNPVSGDAGMGGTDPDVTECSTHKDCFERYPDDSEENPRACVEGTCVPLLSKECPAVLPLSDNGTWNLLKSTNAIILGAFAPFNGTTLTTNGNNYDLAVTELSDTTQGVYAGSTKRRQVVVVLCNMDFESQDELLVPVKHVIEELKAPGVVGAFLLQDQKYIWENVARDNGVFMMVPVYSDQALIDEQDDGLLWHMLSGANALSVSYQPLLDMTEQHLRALGNLSATEDLKVAHVKAKDEPFLQDTAAFLEANLTYNGQSVSENLDDNLYKSVQITSFYKAPADTQQAAIDAILPFGPHVVIGSTSSEMMKFIIPGIEKGWEAQHPDQPRPFYLLGALDFNDGAMAPLISSDRSMQAGEKPLYERILGMNWPAAADNSVYEAYQRRWVDVYGQREDGYENYYDAMYYLLYGVAAARAPLSGAQIAAGLLRVTASGSKIPQVDVGPGEDMATYVNRLASDTSAKIELVGAMGPPNWDVYGGRNDPASVWCVNALGYYRADQLRYNPSSSALEKTDPKLMTSQIGCFEFPKQ